ncbi:Two-component sensor histidine kinase [Labilithrix luteola]|uniref:histidine kinase n=2 Tax=Labilithrix luteola TaxID=1391654 RepID=A0A0K1Q013_9BACT|nr:Two-component sensor histidine kinase [Labilithrix luteola]
MATTLTLLGGTVPAPRAARLHALKNCLAVIIAVQKLLEREVTGQSRERLQRAQDAAARMRGLLEEDLTRSSRADDAKFCSSEEIAQDMVRRVEDRAEASGVQLLVRCGSRGLRGVRSELVEALANLVLNAIDVTPRGAAVQVSLDDTADGAHLWTVQDSGPGMPREVVAHLGTPFCSRKEGGWGLGLAVVQSIVKRHGGLIRIESSPASGTLASVYFPSSADS